MGTKGSMLHNLNRKRHCFSCGCHPQVTMEHLELQWRLYTAKENNGSDGGGKDDEDGEL